MGWSMIGKYAVGSLGLALAATVVLLGGAPVKAQGKELSEKSVQLLMQYAWALTPPKFTAPDGKTIEAGRGVLDLAGILKAILEVKYPHLVSFEYEKDENDPLPGLAETVGYTKGLLARMA